MKCDMQYLWHYEKVSEIKINMLESFFFQRTSVLILRSENFEK